MQVQTNWRKFLQALQELQDKRFTRLHYRSGGCYCAVGAFLPEYSGDLMPTSRVLFLRVLNPDAVLEGENIPGYLELDSFEKHDSARKALERLLQKRTGLSKQTLMQVQTWNDLFSGSPEERYAHIVAKVREQVYRQEEGE